MEDDQESDLAPWTTPLDIVIEAYAISVIRNAGWLSRSFISAALNATLKLGTMTRVRRRDGASREVASLQSAACMPQG